eukprot:Hpha_TRINITY_DN16485_c2_g9::TRINITY_DN16485_c2_g9_i1::g.160463::m.160463/K15381/DIRC2, SLC49A3; MFS transporter, FLVCR family, disrupted in renal carcinoma protein 2
MGVEVNDDLPPDSERLLSQGETAPPECRRWYLLFVAALICSTQGGVWSNFGPISGAVEPLYGWGDGTIALLSNWGPICFLTTVVPYTFVFNSWGLRGATVLTSGLLAVGAVLRCIVTTPGEVAPLLMHAGQILNGVAGPYAMSVGPVLSAQWFPVHERTTATSIAAVANYGGTALTFVLGPALVPEGNGSGSDVSSPAQLDATASDLRTYMFGEAVLCLALFIATVVHFPSRPASDPSRSAGMKRMPVGEGLRHLAASASFRKTLVAYGAVTGVYGSWGSMLGPSLKHVLSDDDAESKAGWLGFWGAVAGCVSGVPAAILSDRLHQRGDTGVMKSLCVWGLGIGAVCFIAFALMCQKIIPFNLPCLYVLSTLGGFAINGTIPLFFELAVESAYPVSEALTTMVLTAGNNVACLLFLTAPSIRGLGTSWMNWVLAGTSVVACIIMLTCPGNLRRLNYDLE